MLFFRSKAFAVLTIAAAIAFSDACGDVNVQVLRTFIMPPDILLYTNHHCLTDYKNAAYEYYKNMQNSNYCANIRKHLSDFKKAHPYRYTIVFSDILHELKSVQEKLHKQLSGDWLDTLKNSAALGFMISASASFMYFGVLVLQSIDALSGLAKCADNNHREAAYQYYLKFEYPDIVLCSKLTAACCGGALLSGVVLYKLTEKIRTRNDAICKMNESLITLINLIKEVLQETPEVDMQ